MKHIRNTTTVAAGLAVLALAGCRADADAGAADDVQVDAVEVHRDAPRQDDDTAVVVDRSADDEVAGRETDASPPSAPARGNGQQVEGPAQEARTDPADPAAQVLARVDRTYGNVRSMSADFVQRLEVPLLDDVQVSRGRLYQNQPNRFAMRFTDPEGDLVVADGRYLWMYYPSSDPRQVMRGRLQEGGSEVDLLKEFLTDTAERFRATHEGRETVDGRQVDVLTLIPRQRAAYRSVRLWVDREDGLVRRLQVTEDNQTVRRLDLRNIRLNPQLPNDLFQFEPPPGAQVFDQ